MIGLMRTKFGPKVIGAIIAVIAFVFIFYGVFMPGMDGGGGGSGPGTAGEVNGEPISYTEFSRAYAQRVEFFKNMMGGKITEEQLEKMSDIRGAVFADLSQRKLMGQIAKKEGFYPSAEQIRDQILRMDVFKKDGRFDKVLYKNVLTQNQYTPTRFEELIGHDLMEQNFRNFLSSLAFVSDSNVMQELKSAKERAKFKYVFIDNESVRKTLAVKDLKPEEQAKKLNEKVDQVAAEALAAMPGGDSKVNSALKDLNVKVKTSEWLPATAEFIPGVGSIAPIKSELFSQKKGQPAKRYSLMGGTLIASTVDYESFDATKVTAKEKADIMARLQNQKQSEVLMEFIKAWKKKASIKQNDAVVIGGKGQHVPVMPDDGS